MNSKEALREMVTSTLKYNDNLIDKVANLSNIVLKDLDRLEKLEKEKEELLLAHSKVLKDFSDTNQYTLDIINENTKLKKENQELKIEIKELKVLNENLNKYIDNFRQNSDIQYLHDNQQIYKLKQENQELKEQVDYYKKEMESEQCFRENLQIDLIEFVGAIKILKDFFIIHQKNSDYLITATGFDKLSQMDYELLKRVFESVGGE